MPTRVLFLHIMFYNAISPSFLFCLSRWNKTYCNNVMCEWYQYRYRKHFYNINRTFFAIFVGCCTVPLNLLTLSNTRATHHVLFFPDPPVQCMCASCACKWKKITIHDRVPKKWWMLVHLVYVCILCTYMKKIKMIHVRVGGLVHLRHVQKKYLKKIKEIKAFCVCTIYLPVFCVWHLPIQCMYMLKKDCSQKL